MKYTTLLAFIFILISCKTENDCSKLIPPKDSNGIETGFMLHGGILDQYDRRVFISIVRIKTLQNKN